MRPLIRAIGYLLVAAGALGLLLVDIGASIWLYHAHGIGWVILTWVTWLPLLILPFIAGNWPAFVLAAVVLFVGNILSDIPDRKEIA